MTVDRQEGRTGRVDGFFLPLVLLWLAGASLRLTVLALPPVLDEVTSALKLSAVDVGVLTAIPPFAFAVGAIPGAMLIGRVGARWCLVLGLGIAALAAATRGFAGGTLALEAASGVMCIGVALMQPAMPALVRAWVPQRIGLASATYTFGLLVGEIAPVTWPLHVAVFGLASGWRSQLFSWSVPVGATAMAIIVLQPHTTGREFPKRHTSPWPDWSNPAVWRIGLLMGAVGAVYLGLNGFIPGWLGQHGASQKTSATLVALNMAQLPAVMLMLRFADVLALQAWAYMIPGLALMVASVLLAVGLAPATLPAAVTAGFCSAILLSLVLTLQPLVADEEELPALAARTFAIGFTVAGIVALLTGWLNGAGPQWLGVVPIGFACAIIVVVGWSVRRLRVR